MFEIKVPEVGESISEGFLVEWNTKTGSAVAIDAPLFELETDKITMTVTAEAAGVVHIDVAAGETVQVGQVVGRIDTEASPSTTTTTTTAAAAAEKAEQKNPPVDTPAGKPRLEKNLAAGNAAEQAAREAQLDDLAPAVRPLVIEHKLDPSAIPATGRGGRLTKADVVNYLATQAPADDERSATQSSKVGAAVATPAPVHLSITAPTPKADSQRVVSAATPDSAEQPRQTRSKMSRLRSRVAERLVEAQHNAAILTTFNELDMSQVMAMRSQFKDAFAERHDVRLGFMSFFIKAVVDALKLVPSINAQIDGDEIVQNHYYDIGVAVGSPRGLVVPVLRDCDKLSMAEIEGQLADLAVRARDGKLTIAELSGGVFTISNGGVYGSLLSTPILNPPQSGILGMHGIKKRPVVVDDQIVIRPMMYVALSYDHRLVDGTEAVIFLKRIVELIEKPERIMLEV